MAAAMGLAGVLLGGLGSTPEQRLYGLAGAAGFVGFAQSLHHGGTGQFKQHALCASLKTIHVLFH